MFSDYQDKLFPYAYNILGSVDDSLDVIQDVMMKYPSIKKQNFENETAYLVRSVINQALTMKSRNKKMISKAWLPEPVTTEYADTNIKKEEVISYSMLVLMEQLDPKERAVFILKEAFDYSHAEIAETLSISIENSRKLLSRARKTLTANKEQFGVIPKRKNLNESLENYIKFIKNGDVESLETMLSEEITLIADGGDKVNVVKEITEGGKAVLDLILFLYDKYQKDYSIRFKYVNYQPAILFYNNGTLINCQVFEIDKNDIIQAIYSVVDPDKLKNIDSVSTE